MAEPLCPPTEKVAILDCGAQYTKVIDRRVRELNVATDILPVDCDPATLQAGGYAGVILSGGPNSVYDPTSPRCDEAIFELGLPILGICYGMQLMTRHFGGVVAPGGTEAREYGETDILIEDGVDGLFAGLDRRQTVLMSHGDHVEAPASGFRVVGRSLGGTVAAIEDPARKLYGVQFHPEVELSVHGQAMLQNFLYGVCGLTGAFVLEDRLEAALSQIRQTVGERPVFVLVSGGVDSSVTAALLVKALGPEQVFAVHIDSGLMRQAESDLVCEALQAIGLKHLRRIDAEADFLEGTTDLDGRLIGPLSATVHPEEKRRIIGDVFYRLITQAIAESGLDLNQTFIAQGTLRPDLIESGNRDISATAQTIKTHHNDVPLIRAQREKGLILEPNRDWHKDEVRQVGRLLGLPEALVARQPFPGPGLGIRVLCADAPYRTPDHADTVAALNAAVAETGLPGLQGLLLPFRSVGVQGDGRSYRHVAALYLPSLAAPDSDVDPALLDTLRHLARELTNRIPALNRVILTLSGGPLPAEVTEITPTHLTREAAAQLRVLDHEVTETFREAGLTDRISQLLTVLLPVDTAGQGRRSAAIRGVVTSDYMTARPAMPGREAPWPLVRDLAHRLVPLGGLDRVYWDLTGKPPATVEWE